MTSTSDTSSLTLLIGIRKAAHSLIHRRLRAPRLPHVLTPDDFGLVAREVCVTTEKGKQLFGWFFDSNAPNPQPAIVIMHGWGSNASMMLPSVQPLIESGIAVLLLDARCHGLSDGDNFMSLPRFAEDMAAGLAWLRCQAGVDNERLALMGHSVGAAAAMFCASQRNDVAAVVSLASFAHPREVMRRFLRAQRVPYFPLGWYVMGYVERVIGYRFDDIAPLATLPRVRCPVLLVHGIDDQTVPFSDAERMNALVDDNTHLLPVIGGHDLSDAVVLHHTQLVRFLHQSFANCSV